MTTGAISGNFKNRDELLLSLGLAYWAPIEPTVKSRATFPEILGALAVATLAAIPDRRAAAVGRLTGLAHTLTHEELHAKVTEFTAQSYAFGERRLRSITKEEDLPMRADHLVRAIHALTEGLVLQRLLTPELMPDEIFHEAFAALGKNTKD